MAIDLRNLRAADLCRVLNSTPLGTVLDEQRLRRLRIGAGMRLGEGPRLDLVRFVAYLAECRHAAPAPREATAPEGYESHRDRAARRQRDQAIAGRDIGPVPAVAEPSRKLACRHDFRLYCETYFPLTFHLAWSDDHLKVIQQIEDSVLRGGLFATAMPRGSGKTTLAEIACIWATLYGHRDFVCLVGSDEGHAAQMLDSIKAELDGNDALAADFPEVCYPIACLDGISNRCGGQLCQGRRTHIGWTASEVVLPTIAGSLASGAVIQVAGLTGGLRGLKFKRPDGRTVRPSLVVVDDPQTDSSARSPNQCRTRERILAGAVLGLAGPGKKISGIMPCTVIAPGDLADNILDRDKHPDWNGTRTKMVYAFPTAEKLWDEYARIRADGLRAEDGGAAATEFYRQHQAAMDAGARVAWPARFNPDELSAIQHAMNLRLRDERAFHAEYQNEPLPEEEARSDDLTPDQICARLNRMPRGAAPIGAARVTAFIDVQASLLFYMVCAWEDDFTGYVLDYGSFPDQKRPHFTLRDAKHTLATAVKAAGLEGQIYGGLDVLVNALMAREWPRDDGASLRIERCLIDANWGSSTDTIYQFCRQSAHSNLVVPSHGRYVGAASKPFREYERRPGDRVGLNWRMPGVQNRRAIRYAIFDANWWKSFLHARLSTAIGDRGALTLFGARADAHRLLADHLCAEYRIRTEGRGRSVDEWKLRPERPDNHWLDCLVGAAVAASMGGSALAEASATPAARRTRRTMAEMRARAQHRA